MEGKKYQAVAVENCYDCNSVIKDKKYSYKKHILCERCINERIRGEGYAHPKIKQYEVKE
jgi:hypothetical protein